MFVSSDVVVAAARCEFPGCGASCLGPGFYVVYVALGGGHAASGENTSVVAGLDVALLAGVGPPASGGPVPCDHPGLRVFQCPPPLRFNLIFCNLAGNVCNYGAVPGEFSWCFG